MCSSDLGAMPTTKLPFYVFPHNSVVNGSFVSLVSPDSRLKLLGPAASTLDRAVRTSPLFVKLGEELTGTSMIQSMRDVLSVPALLQSALLTFSRELTEPFKDIEEKGPNSQCAN